MVSHPSLSPLVRQRMEMEARGRIELPHKGFADLSLTTWVPRRLKYSVVGSQFSVTIPAGPDD